MCSSTKDDRLWLGLVAFVIGAVVLLQRFDIVPSETWDYLWPSILVVSGLKWMVSCGTPMASEMDACESKCGDCGSAACSCEDMSVAIAAPKKIAKKVANKRK